MASVNGIYVGVNGVARKVVKAYVGDNSNIARLFFEAAPFKPANFDSGSDDDITAALTAHYAGKIDIADYWSVGDVRQASDSKPLFQVAAHTRTSPSTDIVKQSTIKWVIIGLKHDDLVSNINGYSKAAITIQTLGTIGTTASAIQSMRMNNSNTNSGGWASTEMRQYLDNNGSGVFYNACNFKSLIKRVQKKYCATYNSSTLSTSNDYIFLLSEYEVFGVKTCSPGTEGSKYAYFTTNGTSEKIKKGGWEGSGYAYAWWERSPYSGNSGNFCLVYNSGNATINNASNSNGVASSACL